MSIDKTQDSSPPLVTDPACALAVLMIEGDYDQYESSREEETANRRSAREAMHRQVEAIDEQADDVSMGGVVSGILVAAGGAATIVSAGVGDTKAGQVWRGIGKIGDLAPSGKALFGDAPEKVDQARATHEKAEADDALAAAQAAHETAERAARVADFEAETLVQILQSKAATATTILSRT